MKTICYYEPSSGFGGSSSNLYHILRQLDKEQFRPIVVVHKDGDQFERIRSLGVEVIKVPYTGMDAFNCAGGLNLIWLGFTALNPLVRRLTALLKEKSVDLVHINTNISLGMPMILAANKLGKKVFCYIRESRALIRRERMMVPKVDQFFILNQAAVKIYGKDIPAAKLHVVPDGVDLSEFEGLSSESFRREFNLEDKKVIGLIGRIVEGKGQLEFAQAAKHVCKRHRDACFVIVGDAKGGDTGYYEALKGYLRREHMGSRVILTGWRTDVKQIMHGLDVLVLASTTFPEGLPNSIIEAMVLGKPAVATDIPGPPEIIEHGKTGFIVAPGDVDAMAARIRELLDDPEQAREMGERGRERAVRLFDVRQVVKTMQDMYTAELTA
ncbi:MAG: glycosyltransferase family 4 protein [Candidatus Omnitrophica bacterium]|nr:glycosyltransferase family 4 protein [Candidatus Omnitrophota bacterium]